MQKRKRYAEIQCVFHHKSLAVPAGRWPPRSTGCLWWRFDHDIIHEHAHDCPHEHPYDSTNRYPYDSIHQHAYR
jgi:hypothetical protein